MRHAVIQLSVRVLIDQRLKRPHLAGFARDPQDSRFALARFVASVPAPPPAPTGTGTGTGTGAGQPVPDTTAPALSGLGLSPTRFEAAGRGGSIARVGTRVSYRLSEAARVRFAVERAMRGRRVGGRCRRASARNRNRPRCTRYVRLRGGFAHRGRQGANRLGFTGRLRGRKLRPGLHRLVARATDAAGNRSTARRARFRIVRKR